MNTANLTLNHKVLRFIFILSFSIITTNLYSQEEVENIPQDLSSQFQELKTESESYNEYKVIKTYKLNTFWKQVEDSLSFYRMEIGKSSDEIALLKREIGDLNNKLSEINKNLEKSESRNESIAIFGLQLSKTLYNIIVWAIIGGLLILTGSMFVAFKSNMISTKKSKKDYHDLIAEFEIYRKESRDKQMKLGRELQTERNKLEEYKEKYSKREKAH